MIDSNCQAMSVLNIFPLHVSVEPLFEETMPTADSSKPSSPLSKVDNPSLRTGGGWLHSFIHSKLNMKPDSEGWPRTGFGVSGFFVVHLPARKAFSCFICKVCC